jgi:hypothetical protein
MEQGFAFTVIEARDPLGDAPAGSDPRRDFRRAQRLYLGAVPGTDWLHDAIQAEFGAVNYELEIQRRSISAGASNEVAFVALILFGAGAIEFAKAFGQRAGQASADALLDWISERAQERRREAGWEHADPPPSFEIQETDYLTEEMRRELAGLLRRPADSLQVVSSTRTDCGGLGATYRDSDTGFEYDVAVERERATFTRR